MARNANDVGIYLDGTRVAQSTSDTFSSETEIIETTNKDSGGEYDGIPGKATHTMSGEGFVDLNESQSYDALWTIKDDKTKVTVKYSDETQGNERYEGDGYITSLERTGGNDEAETFSYEIQIVGGISQVEIT